MDMPSVPDIFLRFYLSYIETHSPPPRQAKTARNIMNCKTGAYGANISVCEGCGAVQIHYNSYRNRCCPMCQAVPKEKWMDARKVDVLDAPYFHLVFTLPDILNPPAHLGVKVGYICILHSWGSEMNFYFHLHTILLGGVLTSQNQWKDNGNDFFFR